MMVYLSDNKDNFPRTHTWTWLATIIDPYNPGGGSNNWAQTISPYMGVGAATNSKSFVCPTTAGYGKIFIGAQMDLTFQGYMMNGYLGWQQPVSATSVKNPTETTLEHFIPLIAAVRQHPLSMQGERCANRIELL
ncbi:MAG: hypothetical protein ABIR24_02105 [Verrucomicrobiota bacterium]